MPTDAATWEYKGVTITLDAVLGEFVAVDGLKRYRAPSLDAIKAKIDKNIKIAFEPFEALNYDEPTNYGGEKPKPGKIRAPRKVQGLHVPSGRHTYRNSPTFLVQRDGAAGVYNVSSVIPNTSENRQAVQALLTAKHANNILRAKMKAEEEALEAEITYIDARRYAAGDKRALTDAERRKL